MTALIAITAFNIGLTALVWFTIGKRSATLDVLKLYKESCELNGRLYGLLEAYRQKYGKEEDDE